MIQSNIYDTKLTVIGEAELGDMLGASVVGACVVGTVGEVVGTNVVGLLGVKVGVTKKQKLLNLNIN